MWAIYKKELRSLFTSMMGYVLIAFILEIIGLYYSAVNLQSGHAEFAYVLSSVTFLLLVVSPLLTMRVMVEEKRQSTDRLLYTSPVSVMEIIIGKYLAMVTVFFIPIAFLCACPLIMSLFGLVSMARSYTALLGFFLLGSATISVGMYISTVSDSQIVSAIGTFVLLLLSYLITSITALFTDTAILSHVAFTVLAAVIAGVYYYLTKRRIVSCLIILITEAVLFLLRLADSNFIAGSFTKLLECLDLFSPFEQFTGAMFDLTAVIYYLSAVGLFLLFSFQSIQKKRLS